MPGASLLPNDADANPAPQPSVSTNDSESTITDQVITRIEPLSLPLAPEENGLPDTPPVRTLFLVSEESGGDTDTEYDSDGNTGPSFEQVEGEPDIETYHEDEVVANAPNTNPVAPEDWRTQVSDTTLHPEDGKLKRRLEAGDHWPLPNVVKDPICQMHFWATQKKYRKQTMYCAKCGVTLCLICYKKFHTISHLVDMKEKIKCDYNSHLEDRTT